MEKQIKNSTELKARIHFRIPVSLRLDIEKKAEQHGETLSDLCRTIIESGLETKQNDGLK